MRYTTHSSSRRAGFTLIELLVVVAIIGILVALSASAVIRYLGVQQKANSETAITKISPQLKDHWAAVVHQANNEPLDRFGPTAKAAVMAMADNDEKRARVIWIKLRLRQEFPICYAEAINPAPLPAIAEYRTTAQRAGAPPAFPGGPTESSACLLMALQKGRSGAQILSASDLGSNVVQDTNGDGVPEIVDGWGQPVAFIRFPTGYYDLNPGAAYPQSAPQAGVKNDTLDKDGLLAATNWSATGRSSFQNALHPLPASGSFQSFRLHPLIISAGPNRTLGLNHLGQIGNVNDANDNISSYKLDRLDARGD